jgi:hypothetical protein
MLPEENRKKSGEKNQVNKMHEKIKGVLIRGAFEENVPEGMAQSAEHYKNKTCQELPLFIADEIYFYQHFQNYSSL